MPALQQVQRRAERIGALLPSGRRYRLERRVRGWFEQRRLRASDAAIVSFGKSGRTWLRVMLSRLYKLAYGFDDDPLLEFDNLHARNPAIPKILFTHDNYLRDYTGDGTSKAAYAGHRVVLLARHPADVAVSQYFQWQHRMRPHKIYLNGYPEPGTELTPFEFIMSDSGLPKVIGFLNEWAAAIDQLDALLVASYEELRGDTPGTLQRIAEFLHIPLAAGAIADAVEYAAFENMKNREANAAGDSDRLRAADTANADSFKARRGKVGGYRDYCSDSEIAAIRKLIGETLREPFLSAYSEERN
jgi:hypothetical protein